MKYINNYDNLATYTADGNRPVDKSTVSNIADGTGLKFEGKNIILEKESAEIGDICVYDKITRRKMFVKFSTFASALLPVNFIVVGVVYYRTTDKVHILSGWQDSAQWGAPYQVKLTGFDLSVGGSFTITINATTTAAIEYATTDTLAAIATKIMTALTASGFTSATGWSVTAGADYIVVQQNWYTPNVTIFNVTDASLKIAKTILTGNYQTSLSGIVTANSQIFRNDKSVSSYAGANFARFLAYYEVNGVADVNIPVGSSSIGIIKRSVFNSIDNPVLFAYYASYESYIQDRMTKYPYSKGTIFADNGKSDTDKLSVSMYTNAAGVVSPAYPAAYKANRYGISVDGHVTGFEPGNWWLPSSPEMLRLIRNITWGLAGVTAGNEDIVNRALVLIGGTRISATSYYWCSAESSSYYAWYSNGIGNIAANSKYGSFGVRPVTAF
nr:hypothetical protein [uncultured Macellibacteroides sp.]